MTPKQEAFARAFVKTGNGAEAYRIAYASQGNADTCARRAKDLLSHGKIAALVASLRAKANARCAVTVESLVAELEETRAEALGAEKGPQCAAAVAATLGKAKLLGLGVEKVDHTSSDGSMSPPATIQIRWVDPTAPGQPPAPTPAASPETDDDGDEPESSP